MQFVIASILSTLTGHTWAVLPYGHMLVICQLMAHAGQMYANGCFR